MVQTADPAGMRKHEEITVTAKPTNSSDAVKGWDLTPLITKILGSTLFHHRRSVRHSESVAVYYSLNTPRSTLLLADIPQR